MVDAGLGVEAVPLEVEGGGFLFVLAVDVEEEEAAAAAAEVEVLGLFAGVAADLGVGVVDGAAADFDEAGFGMLGGVLPVAVTADDVEVGDGFEEGADFVAFGFEDVVGEVVFFAAFVGADDGGGAHDELEGGFGFAEGFFEPGFLCGAEDGFVGAIGDVVGAAEVAAFEEPHLEVAAPGDGAVGKGAVGDLLFEDFEALREGEVAVFAAGPGVVVEGVVVVLHEVGREMAVEVAVPLVGEHAVPALAGGGGVFGEGLFAFVVFVVVDDVATVDEEVGIVF